MILNVEHVTRYSFAQPVRGVIQSHRLVPSKHDGQKILSWNVDVPGAILGTPFRDTAGDLVRTISLRGAVDGLEVIVTGQVETLDTAGVLRGHRERVPPLAYLRHTARTQPNRAISDLADNALARGHESSPLERAHLLANAVADTLPYQPGATHAHTTAAEALEAGAGVCQDHAHLLIAMALHAGLPARYVTGYLLASADGTPHEASHAWAELHIASLGWVGFDPANACCPDDRYIRLGSGLDAQDAAPIRGLVLDGAEEQLDVTVQVGACQQ